MNFNFNSQPEYTLQTSLIEEMINLYGVQVKFLVTEKINPDEVFGDYSHLKSDSEKIYSMNMLPENSEDWNSDGYNFSNFGLVNLENVTLFAPRSYFPELLFPKFSSIVGNLLIFPNNKIMEITDVDATVPGINNLYTFNDSKSVYKLTCKPYDFKLINEIPSADLGFEENMNYETLDSYFQELIDENSDQNTEAEVTTQVTIVQTTDDIDSKVQKPIVDKTEQDVWGSFS